MKNKFFQVGLPLIAVLALTVGILIGSHLRLRPGSSASALAKVGELFSMISDDYVDQVDLDSLLEESLPEILSHLDPHTAYIPARNLEAVNNDLEGSFSGIGIQFQLNNDSITVVEVISGGPSQKVGLLPGDRIVEVNDTAVVGKHVNADTVRSKLRGPRDTQVNLKIVRPGSPEKHAYTVVRGDIPITSIDASYLIAPEIGYIKVNKFGRNTFAEFFTQMVMLRSAGAKDFIIDLRGNGGGYLDVAIRMANEFLNAGNGIVETRGRDGRVIESVVADGSGTFKKAKLTVLLDEFSASASEIVAGALQDNDRATIVGRRSFGKGLVQQQRDLSDGSALRLTTARYYTPSGRCIQKPFTKGNSDDYQLEVYDRYASGEVFNADSVKIDRSLLYHTRSGREVYGGGGIMPDIFVPADTANITSYYSKVSNSGLIHRYAFRYVDSNRHRLDQASNVDELLQLLPADDALLADFASYAASQGVPARWYYINISRPLLLNSLKALIAHDILGTAAFYEINNLRDNAVKRALQELQTPE